MTRRTLQDLADEVRALKEEVAAMRQAIAEVLADDLSVENLGQFLDGPPCAD